MKNNIIRSIIVFVLVLQFTSCKKEEPNKKSISKTVEKVGNDTIFDRKNQYYPFVEKNHPEVLDYKIKSFWEKDLDADGQNEAIIAFGRDSDTGLVIENILVLKNENGIIKEIKSDIGFKEHSFSDVKLISLRGKNKYYINLEIFEGPYSIGFAIYEMVDNKVQQIFTSPSVDEKHEYDYELIDSNKDGQIDGFIQNINYELFDIKSQFSFENNTFRLKKRYYIMDEYPQQIKPVITQYICIRSLGFTDNISNKRLQELCIDKTIQAFPFNVENWESAYLKIANYDDDGLEIKNENDNGEIAEANLNFTDPKKNINYALKFELQKTDDKWQIRKIELL